MDPTPRPFHDRPTQVLDAGRFAAAALQRVDDPALSRLPLIGAVDQLLDCTDVVSDQMTQRRRDRSRRM